MPLAEENMQILLNDNLIMVGFNLFGRAGSHVQKVLRVPADALLGMLTYMRNNNGPDAVHCGVQVGQVKGLMILHHISHMICWFRMPALFV